MSKSVALVLGAAVWPGGRASPTLRRRALLGAQLVLSGEASHVIGCGGLGLSPPTEAEAIRRICLEAGVNDDAILCEDRSRNTLENISNALPQLRALGCTTVIVVTDRYHVRRALMVARHFGLSATSRSPDAIGTPRRRLIRSWLREAPALATYALRLAFSARR